MMTIFLKAVNESAEKENMFKDKRSLEKLEKLQKKSLAAAEEVKT